MQICKSMQIKNGCLADPACTGDTVFFFLSFFHNSCFFYLIFSEWLEFAHYNHNGKNAIQHYMLHELTCSGTKTNTDVCKCLKGELSLNAFILLISLLVTMGTAQPLQHWKYLSNIFWGFESNFVKSE